MNERASAQYERPIRSGGKQSIFRGGLDSLYRFAGYLAGLFLIVIFILMMARSFGRIIGFNIPAGDDFASWSMAAMAFLGLAHTFKSGRGLRPQWTKARAAKGWPRENPSPA